MIFVMIIATLNPNIRLIEMGYELNVLFINLFIIVLLIIISRGKFTLTNVTAEMVSTLLIQILEERSISYEERENYIYLKNYEDKCIYYKQSFNSVEINLRNIRTLSFFKEIKKELRLRIKRIESTVFPTIGVIFIVLGVIFMIAVKHL